MILVCFLFFLFCLAKKFVLCLDGWRASSWCFLSCLIVVFLFVCRISGGARQRYYQHNRCRRSTKDAVDESRKEMADKIPGRPLKWWVDYFHADRTANCCGCFKCYSVVFRLCFISFLSFLWKMSCVFWWVASLIFVVLFALFFFAVICFYVNVACLLRFHAFFSNIGFCQYA